MATDEGPADPKKAGWRFHFPVCLAIAGGLFLILLAEVGAGARAISTGLKDFALILGGTLVGLGSLSLNEIYRAQPERLRSEEAREAERERHQEERRLDFEEYRALQTELRVVRLRAASLQSKLDLTGAVDRDRVGDALVLGFYFHRRNDRLPSGGGSIFKRAGERLKLAEPKRDLKLEKSAVQQVLHIAYGPVVAESFHLGYLLSHLGDEEMPQTSSPEILGELERHLKALKLGAEIGSHNGRAAGAATLFQRLASRVVSVVRRG